MPSLSAHLRDRDTHARLPFHPECPICRDGRLLGEVSPHAVVAQRAVAALAAAALAVTTIGPAAAFATEPDSEREGAPEPTEAAADVMPPAKGDHAHTAVFDPGGGATDSPVEADDDDAEPDDPALDDPRTAPVVDDDAPDAVDSHDQPADLQPGPPVQPAPPPAAPAPDPAPPAIPAQQPPTPAARPSASPPAPRAHVLRHAPSRARAAPAPRNAPTRPGNTTHAAAPAPTPRAPTNTRTTADHADRAARSKRAARTHTVRAGESLWSIAGDALGPAAQPFEIAREVHRLWELNKERIGTGDPDLLMIDTRLRLR